MRGDSVRDLYAKTLALLGLGVLAGTGALVDYWPVGLSTPAVDMPFVSSPLPGPIAVTSLAEPALVAPPPSAVERPLQAPGRARPVSAVGRSATPAVPERSSVDSRTSPTPALLIASAASLPLGIGVRLREPVPVVEPLPGLAADAVGPDGAPLLIAANGEPPAGVPRARLAPTQPAPASSGDEADGLIAGAFKKAGSSIIKTGARTGASIFDSFRVVSSMVRRVLPSD